MSDHQVGESNQKCCQQRWKPGVLDVQPGGEGFYEQEAFQFGHRSGDEAGRVTGEALGLLSEMSEVS
ncbi:hypothetical protein, partial [Streptomyces sp. NPDC007205]|uniref:hypothetical protein n=1 Tax=Streptomyces sp. NPDC007205 TaxID=3154316 RepID=UPI0033E08115